MAMAAGGALLPDLDMKPHHAYFLNLVYGGLAILSFLSCLMYGPHLFIEAQNLT